MLCRDLRVGERNQEKSANEKHIDIERRKSDQIGWARCPIHEKSITYIPLGRVHPEEIHPEGLPTLQKEFFRDPIQKNSK
jgi:hypothetical protein